MEIGVGEVPRLLAQVEHDRMNYEVDSGTHPIEFHRDRINEKGKIVGDHHQNRVVAVPANHLTTRVESFDRHRSRRPGTTQFAMVSGHAKEIPGSSSRQIFRIHMREIVANVRLRPVVEQI